MSWPFTSLGNLFSSSSVTPKNPSKEDSKQGEQPKLPQGPLPGPVEAPQREVVLSELNAVQQQPVVLSKIEQMRLLLASMSLEEKKAIMQDVVQDVDRSIEVNCTQKQQEWMNFLKTFRAPAPCVDLFKILPYARKYCEDAKEFHGFISNGSGMAHPPSEKDTEKYRLDLQKFYGFVTEFEKNPKFLDCSKFEIFDLFWLLICEGLEESKPAIAQIFVEKVVREPLLDSDNRPNFYLDGKDLEQILKYYKPNLDQVKKLMRHMHPNALLNGSHCQDALIPTYFTQVEYLKELACVFKDHSDNFLTSWIHWQTTEPFYIGHVATHISKVRSLATQLAHVCMHDEALEPRIIQLAKNESGAPVSNTKWGRQFLKRFQFQMANLKAHRNFSLYLEKNLKAGHLFLKSLEIRNQQSLWVDGNFDRLIHLYKEEEFKEYIEIFSGDKSLLMNVLDLESLLKMTNEFEESSLKQRLCQLVKMAGKVKLKLVAESQPELMFKLIDLVYQDKEAVKKLEKAFYSESKAFSNFKTRLFHLTYQPQPL